MFKRVCDNCRKEYTPAGGQYHKCAHCGHEHDIVYRQMRLASKEFYGPVVYPGTTDYYNAVELANRMLINGANQYQVELATGL